MYVTSSFYLFLMLIADDEEREKLSREIAKDWSTGTAYNIYAYYVAILCFIILFIHF